ncbi:unnamed protein product [Paramecium pentaurelia]|uniref:Uncharacterized protein n=1 Tax=Paramecium pentaurelia TaxID=43138 RepID=A0A8S1X4F9_9CILI|nr:unnamed protein product [Paramecium pentaurelia]
MFSIIRQFNFIFQILEQNSSNILKINYSFISFILLFNLLNKSFESESQTFSEQIKLLLGGIVRKILGNAKKSEENKQKIIQNLQYAQEKFQISIENKNSNKASQFQKKIQNLEGEMQKINQKDKIVKDYHQVYDRLIQQLQITQDQKANTLQSAQRNNQLVYKVKFIKKHIDPLFEICQRCNNPDNRLEKNNKSQDEMNQIQQKKKQLQSDSQFQSQFNLFDRKNSQRGKENPYQYEENKIYHQFQGGQYENKKFIQSQQEDKYSKQWNKKYYEQPKKPYQKYHLLDIDQQFDTEDKNQEYENPNQMKKQQLKTETLLDDSN